MRFSDIRSEMPALLRLAFPLILGELGWMAMSIVDTIMVGRLPHSAVSLAAASLAQVLFNTFTFGISGVLLGLDTLISQAFGALDLDDANRWLLQGILMALALSAVLLALFIFAPSVLRMLPIDRAVLAIAVPAMRGLNYGVLPLLLYFTFRRYLQAGHHVRPIAFALVSANLVNIAGDWLLLYGHHIHFGAHTLAIPAFGVVGSSWSTSFARLYMMAVLLAAVVIADRRHNYGLRGTPWSFDWSRQLRLLRLGAPVGAQIFVEISIFAAVTTLIATFGPLQLAGHEVALQCASATFMVPFAISAAASVRVGNAIGRLKTGLGGVAQVAAAGWSGIVAGAAFMLLAAIAFLTLPGTIARLFTPNRGVIAAAVPLIFGRRWLSVLRWHPGHGLRCTARRGQHHFPVDRAACLLLAAGHASGRAARLPRAPGRDRPLAWPADRPRPGRASAQRSLAANRPTSRCRRLKRPRDHCAAAGCVTGVRLKLRSVTSTSCTSTVCVNG